MNSKIDYKLIGQRIKLKRKKAGFTQEQLAEKLFVTPGYISQLERGISRPNLDTLSEICHIVNCDIVDLLHDSTESASDYLLDEIHDLYSLLSPKEKSILFELLKSYVVNR